LDIPRVNTIVIEDAHKLGLAQLYQLRGRVGRAGIQAHAYLLYPPNLELTYAAKKRLDAIQEFSQLGSGYQQAMRDMEIRGLGDLLGEEQSGQADVIGFALYMDLLQEYINELRGKILPEVADTELQLPRLVAFIPDTIAAIVLRHSPMLPPIAGFSLFLSAVTMAFGLRRSYKFPWSQAIWRTVSGMIYMLHWIPVIASVTLRMCILPKRLKWVKTLHQGAGENDNILEEIELQEIESNA
jgi:hypothetical protein